MSSSSSESDSDLSDNEDGQTGLGGAGGGGTEPGGRGYRPFSNIESRTRSRMGKLIQREGPSKFSSLLTFLEGMPQHSEPHPKGIALYNIATCTCGRFPNIHFYSRHPFS